MKNVLVTGARGFVGKNLVTALRRREDDLAVNVFEFTSASPADQLSELVEKADIIFHLAGSNRPEKEEEFQTVNVGLTQTILECLEKSENAAPIVISSSTQAEKDNPYGRSKLAAENAVADYQKQTGKLASIYRLPGVFGKWSRPNYNTVVATFCHRLSRGEEISINDPSSPMTLVYIDEVVRCFLRHLDDPAAMKLREEVEETFELTVGELADRLRTINEVRKSLKIPDLGDPLNRYLYSTYNSFLAEDNFASSVDLKTDDRGWLFELVKSESFGQIFVSTTKPGITRGNHYHDTKIEKFCLIQGQGIIRFRHLESEEVLEYPVNDSEIKIVDIPPGYTHSIENSGDQTMLVLFWANEIFDPKRPDTYWVPVIK